MNDGVDASVLVPIERIRAFLNTLDIESGEDDLGTPDQIRPWLAAQGLPGTRGPIESSGIERLHGVRDALRDVLDAHSAVSRTAGPIDTSPGSVSTVAALNATAAAAPLVVRFDAGGHARLEAAQDDLNGTIAAILADVATCVADGTWARLKICRSDTCRWAFYDESKNHSRTWCSMSVCGNRAKGRAYRRRNRAITDPA